MFDPGYLHSALEQMQNSAMDGTSKLKRAVGALEVAYISLISINVKTKDDAQHLAVVERGESDMRQNLDRAADCIYSAVLTLEDCKFHMERKHG